MKKLLRLAGLTAGIVLTIACAAAAEAAVVDKITPYDGDYFISYNDYIGYAEDEMAYLMSIHSAEPSEEEWETADNSVIAVRENEDGDTIYQLEPQNLEKRIAPPPASSRRRAPARHSGPAKLGDEREFVTVDMTNDQSVRTQFILKYIGEYCNIWLEKNDKWSVTDEMVAELGMEYDVKVHNKIETAFGPFYDYDEDGKLGILLYDIQDGYGDSGGYVSGFFLPGDMQGDKFNGMDVIHIDTYPTTFDSSGGRDLTETKSTIVHELQHLIEYSYCIEKNCEELPLWVNEGLSMAAEHMIYGVLEDRIYYYNHYAALNTPLAEWSRRPEEDLSHYAFSYLFFQYLRVQTQDFTGGGEELFRYILRSPKRTALCVEDGMRQFFPYISISDLFLHFHIARFLNEPTGLDGFCGDTDFAGLRPRTYNRDYANLGSGAAAIVKMPSKSFAPYNESKQVKVRCAGFSTGESGVDSPRASVPSGQVYQFKNITLSCTERYATMYYTVDGTDPDENSLIYTGRPIQIISSTTLKAVTITPDGERSDTAEYHYTITPEDTEFYRFLAGDGNCNTFSYDVLQAPDGCLIQIGGYNRDAAGSGDFYDLDMDKGTYIMVYMAKFNPDGTVQWIKNFGGNYNGSPYCAVALEDGFAIAGATFATGSAGYTGDFEGFPIEENELIYNKEKRRDSAYIAKFDWNGNKQWVNIYPLYNRALLQNNYSNMGIIQKVFTSLAACPDNGVVAVGLTEWFTTGSGYHSFVGTTTRNAGRPIIAKTDAQGNFLWKKELDMGGGCGNFYEVTVLDDGTIVASGYASQNALGHGDLSLCSSTSSKPTSGLLVPVLIAFEQNGTILWEKAFDEYANTYYGYFSHFLPVENGFVVTGYQRILRFTANASECTRVWATSCPGLIDPILADAEDGFMAVGRVSAGDVSKYSAYSSKKKLTAIAHYRETMAVKLDLENGKIQWAQNYATRFFPNPNGDFDPHGLLYLGNRKYAVVGWGSRLRDSSSAIKVGEHSFLFTFYDESTPYYKVSGNVGLPGVSIGGRLSDSEGNYWVKVKQGESVTLTPAMSGYTFKETSRTIGPVTEAVTEVNFIPTEIKYALQGKVVDANGSPLAGVTVAKDVVTDKDGTYIVKVRPGSNVLLEPHFEDKTFEPAIITRLGVANSEEELNFRISKPKHTVSGKVTRDDKGQGGVEVFKGILTEPDGTYSFTVEEGTEVILSPRFQNYTFTPATAPLGAVTADKEQNFTMRPASASPDPEEPDPDKPNPDKPDPDKPDPDKPDPDKPDPGKPDPGKPDPDKPQPEKPTPPSGGGGSEREEKEPTPAKPVQPESKPSGTHISYLQGYPDGGFHPDDPMTRAQCATMLARLLEDYDPEGTYAPLPFSDTAADRWFAGYLSFVHQKGVVKGYPDGSFRPDEPMTRAEFATVVRNILKPENAEAAPFSDTSRHWARNAIGQLAAMDILDGYPDGTFRPDDPISRAEAAKVLNQAYHRAMEKGDRPTGEAPDYSDLTESHWAYYDIWEASVEHSISSFHGND